MRTDREAVRCIKLYSQVADGWAIASRGRKKDIWSTLNHECQREALKCYTYYYITHPPHTITIKINVFYWNSKKKKFEQGNSYLVLDFKLKIRKKEAIFSSILSFPIQHFLQKKLRPDLYCIIIKQQWSQKWFLRYIYPYLRRFSYLVRPSIGNTLLFYLMNWLVCVAIHVIEYCVEGGGWWSPWWDGVIGHY